jgi:hypothetical protein
MGAKSSIRGKLLISASQNKTEEKKLKVCTWVLKAKKLESLHELVICI